MLQVFSLPTLYILDPFFFNKLTNKEVVFLLCIGRQESHGLLIGTLVERRIRTDVQKILILLNQK